MTGVLLAGGRSLRMGRDKAALQFEGEPLAVRVARCLAEVCAETLVASGDGVRLAWLGLPQVADSRPGAGPLGGLVAGLEAASNALVAVVAVDMPFASPAVLRLLAEALGDRDAAVPVGARGPEPLHAVFAKRAAPALRECLESGELAVHAALRTLRVRYVVAGAWEHADPTGMFAVNLNRPADLDPAVPPDGDPLPKPSPVSRLDPAPWRSSDPSP